jgi:hypothetical protein
LVLVEQAVQPQKITEIIQFLAPLLLLVAVLRAILIVALETQEVLVVGPAARLAHLLELEAVEIHQLFLRPKEIMEATPHQLLEVVVVGRMIRVKMHRVQMTVVMVVMVWFLLYQEHQHIMRVAVAVRVVPMLEQVVLVEVEMPRQYHQ